MAKAPLQLSRLFVDHAADVLGDTNTGLTGGEIIKKTGAYAYEFSVNIPHTATQFEAPNKRTALADNLMAFSEE
jgi:hypothetical protein